MGVGDYFNFNKYAKFFKVGRMSEDLKQRETLINSQGYSQEQLDMGMTGDSAHADNIYNGMTTINVQFDQYFNNKAQRIATYREMSRFPEISDAIDIICDDAMSESSKGNMVELDIKEELPTHIEDEIRKQWDYLLGDVFNFNNLAWDFFRRWLVEGELYTELILNNEGDDIYGFKILPAHTMVPVYADTHVDGYVQSLKPIMLDGSQNYGVPATDDENVYFDKDQIVYINYGEFGRNKYDVIGFLEASVRTYNQLKNLEDAVVIYRIVRAPERRIWNIGTGRMPKVKADEFVQGVMQRYRKRIKYDSSTGAMDSSQNVFAMVEDFWFSKSDDNDGTTVTQLESGQNLGEMQDVEYFLKKLYKTLKLPSSRWGDVEGTHMYSTGKSGEITREEIKFSRFVERLQKKFKPLLMESFITLLRIRNVVDDVYIDENLYNVIFTESNIFKEYKELELLETRFGLLGAIEAYIYKPEENENGYFSKEFVLRNWFMMSDEEYDKNKELLESEKAAATQAQAAVGAAEGDESPEGFGTGGGDTGGGFGGEDTGEEEGFGDEEGKEFQADPESPGEELEPEAPAESIKNMNNSILSEFVKIDREMKNKKRKLLGE